jgi:hypothetical protein
VVRRLVERLPRYGQELRRCYEAGPCGYGLHWQLTELGCHCVVVTPALIPRRPEALEHDQPGREVDPIGSER